MSADAEPGGHGQRRRWWFSRPAQRTHVPSLVETRRARIVFDVAALCALVAVMAVTTTFAVTLTCVLVVSAVWLLMHKIL